MKAVLVVSLMVAQVFASVDAVAKIRLAHTQEGDSAMAAYPAPAYSAPRLYRNGNDCAGERASAVFGAAGSLAGYECLSNANGP